MWVKCCGTCITLSIFWSLDSTHKILSMCKTSLISCQSQTNLKITIGRLIFELFNIYQNKNVCLGVRKPRPLMYGKFAFFDRVLLKYWNVLFLIHKTFIVDGWYDLIILFAHRSQNLTQPILKSFFKPNFLFKLHRTGGNSLRPPFGLIWIDLAKKEVYWGSIKLLCI